MSGKPIDAADCVPQGVQEALQRLIENAATLGPASREDALLVARHRALALTAAQQQGQGGGEVVQRLRGVLQHAKMGNSYLISQDLIHKAIGAITAPPSAPVELRNAILDALNLVHAEGRARVESATAEMADRLAALAQQPAAVDEARWQPIATMPTDDTIVLAKTGDGRVMIYRGSILARNLLGPTPEHLKFPAVKWMQIPGDVE